MYRRGVAATYPSPAADEQRIATLIPLPPPTTFARPRPPRKEVRQEFVLDVSQCSAEEIHAATTVAGAWRGFLTRRKYRTNHITSEFQYRKAVTLQSFIRAVGAKVARREAHNAREAWVAQRTQQFVDLQLDKLEQLIGWQRAKYETAALKIQKLFRWYMRGKNAREVRRASIQLQSSGMYPNNDEEELERPPTTRKSSIFKHERRRSTKLSLGEHVQLPPDARGAAAVEAKYRRVSSVGQSGLPQLAFQEESYESPADVKTPQSGQLVSYDSGKKKRNDGAGQISPLRTIRPPPLVAIIAANDKMRRQLEMHQQDLEQQAERIATKQHGIVVQDMEHCASVLQRRFRMNLASQELHSRKCLTEYVNKYAVIVQRAVKCYFSRVTVARKKHDQTAKALRMNRQYDQQQVSRVAEEFVWNRFQMEQAAKAIQQVWRAYARRARSIRRGSEQMSSSIVAELTLGGSKKRRGTTRAAYRRWRGSRSSITVAPQKSTVTPASPTEEVVAGPPASNNTDVAVMDTVQREAVADPAPEEAPTEEERPTQTETVELQQGQGNQQQDNAEQEKSSGTEDAPAPNATTTVTTESKQSEANVAVEEPKPVETEPDQSKDTTTSAVTASSEKVTESAHVQDEVVEGETPMPEAVDP